MLVELRFACFIIYFFLFQIVVWEIYESDLLRAALLNQIAKLAASLYAFFGKQPLLTDNILSHLDNGRYLIINPSCSGVQMTATLIAGLLAFRCKKLYYYILTIIAVQVLNQLRIVHLFSLIHDDWDRFNFYHLYVWQIFNFIFACSFFSTLLRYKCKHDSI